MSATRPQGALRLPPGAPVEPAPLTLRRAPLASLVPLALAVTLLGTFFLGSYFKDGYGMPIGWDTARYLSQANFAAEYGLGGLQRIDPPPERILSSRVAFSVVDLSLSSLFSIDRFKVAAAIPAAAAIALALSAAVLASASLGGNAWEAAAFALVVGFSSTIVRLFAPEAYTENLLAGASLLAAVAILAAARFDARAAVAAVLLFVAGAVTHGPSAAIVGGAVAVAALIFLPSSLRAWRSKRAPLLDTLPGRAVVVGGVALALVALVLFGLLGVTPDRFAIPRRTLEVKLGADLQLHRLPLTVPIAALGLAAFSAVAAKSRHLRQKRAAQTSRHWASPALSLALLLGWMSVCAAGILAFYLGRASPAHRFLAFMIPLPILVGMGILATARFVGRGRPLWVGVAVAVAGVAAVGVLGYRTLYVELPRDRGVLWIDASKIQEAANAAAYLDAAHVPKRSPVVFIVEDRGPEPTSYVPLLANMIRTVLPPERIPYTYLYLGDPRRYLGGEPTLREEPPSYNTASNYFFRPLQPVLAARPVALITSSFNPEFNSFVSEHPDTIVAPSVAVVHGPQPREPVAPVPIPRAPRPPFQVLAVGAATTGLLALVGLGWAMALLPGGARLLDRVALAPSLGIAFMVIAGLVVDGAGVRLTGAGGVATVLLAGVPGWLWAIARMRKDPTAALGPR